MDAQRLTDDFKVAVGRPVATVREAADLLGCSVNSIRNLIHSGRLTGSRSVPNGPVRIHVAELARWYVEGERHSLPAPKDS